VLVLVGQRARDPALPVNGLVEFVHVPGLHLDEFACLLLVCLDVGCVHLPSQ